MPRNGAPNSEAALSCPSGQPGMEEARIFGVVGGTIHEPRVGYLKKDAVVTEDMRATLGDMDPTLVFRFAARCEGGRCAQYGNGQCSLGQRIVERLMPVTASLPSCLIRPTCRWHSEQGDAACHRCPQVVTRVPGNETLAETLAVSAVKASAGGLSAAT